MKEEHWTGVVLFKKFFFGTDYLRKAIISRAPNTSFKRIKMGLLWSFETVVTLV